MASLDAEQSRALGSGALSAVAPRGASERSPPLWPGINAALMLQDDADRFTWEARAGKGV